MENMDCFVEMIHMVYRKLKYFHHCLGYMWGLRVNSYLVKRPDASWVPVGVPPTDERELQDIIVGEWGEGNKTSLHIVGDINFYHKRVTGGHKG
jgi:hypothetical protein